MEEKSGLWKELDGGRLAEIGRNEYFRRRTLGFQKVRTHDKPDKKCRVKVRQWLSDWYPAEVEGSDCKSAEMIGNGKACFLKIGDFSFESVKCALTDYTNRVKEEPLSYSHSYIRSIVFEGGFLNGQEIAFSPELNCLIGIRGSGKSSILESLRYALDIPFGENALDKNYKESLLGHILGSGGKILVRAVNRHGQDFEVHRIFNQSPDVFVNSERNPGISIRETVIHQPIYFGQKDLCSSGEGFERDLVEKLLGGKLQNVRLQICEQKERVIKVIERLDQLAQGEDRLREWESKKQNAEFRLKLYKDLGVEEKLQRQLGFVDDGKKILGTITIVESYFTALGNFIETHKSDIHENQKYSSAQNPTFMDEFLGLYKQFIEIFATLESNREQSVTILETLKEKSQAFTQMQDDQKEEFAQVQRLLAIELKSQGLPAVQTDDFLKLHQDVDEATKKIEALSKQQSTLMALNDELWAEVAKLHTLWREEYELVQGELAMVNSSQTPLRLEVEFNGDKNAMLSFMKDTFKGSRIRENTLEILVNDYTDFGEMWQKRDESRVKSGSNPGAFDEYFRRNLGKLLVWQPPNKFAIKYRGKELKEHSLGQRASALMLFVLSQKDNDVVIIDQPEDDLDSQTIYEDVIKLIHQMKVKTQFIFATHHANFPVLGDAEHLSW